MGDEGGIVALADAVSELFYAIAGWLLVGLGALALVAAVSGLVAGGGVGSAMGVALLVVFGLVFVVSGVLVNPRLRRRLDRRHSITRFGRVRSTDRRVVRPGETRGESCVECGADVEGGMATRYREEYALAGIPISTRTEGVNHYCLACAFDESDIPDESSARERPESAPERS
ncbi:hypothetical protein [Halalkalicoccus jeotgali]|uniref:DUF8108 domain-containing protein n=1 Tax=Halalkalicoccus jeotgali (strain DSM 18796 / CECT 7217 / JCM 14584 / KCTC 4019 / B3) TaxID=795797 RepID=D8J4J8_HALJB|nr:hypothetical protein [Halalkalicoccus jeotgali]ADJ13560.1 hypothetical protein HacjB3_00835 [Halalkalicoccus jeotgali B3]ELY33143.1 hypothetical protein C497_18502 [Halalkalicoccus jeotgali B3]